jgi:peptide methionine sulfoxide reductase MsrB
MEKQSRLSDSQSLHSTFKTASIFTIKRVKNASMKYNELTPDEEKVIIRKGTERPFTGEFANNKERGTYMYAGSFKKYFTCTEVL